MEGKKILIIGCGGSGKSTLAQQLSRLLQIPVVNLDRLYWRENWQHVSNDEFDRLLSNELLKPTWIIDGNYIRTMPHRLQYCDTVIYLDYSRSTCIIGALTRILQNYGKTRPDMGTNNPERFDGEFFKWIWNFNRNHRQEILKMLSATSTKQILIFHTRKECKKYLETFQ